MRHSDRGISLHVALLGFVLFAVISAVPAKATTRRVPTEYPTIQSTLDVSSRGDEVLVTPEPTLAARPRLLPALPSQDCPAPLRLSHSSRELRDWKDPRRRLHAMNSLTGIR